MALRYSLGYAFVFCILYLTSHYGQWLSLPPASIHQWRQADGASIAQHYAHNPDFTAIQISNLFYTGDNHAVGELPVLYWLSGLISRQWEYPAYPLRWIGLLLLFAGGWAFGWIVYQMTRRPAFGVLGSGLLLTSPVLGYYGPGFLPDAPAFCFILLMAVCLLRADQRQSAGWLWLAALCAVLAILLKLSMAITPLALALTWGLGKWQRRWPLASLWNSRWPAFTVAAGAAAVLGVRWWMTAYNSQHQATYFLASTRPIWHYDRPFIRETLLMLGTFGLPAFASAGLYLACLAGMWVIFRHWKTCSFEFKSILLFSLSGSVAYCLLWFRMLREHDYYLICLMILPALLLAEGLRLAVQRFPHRNILLFLMVCWLAGIGHNNYIQSKRLKLAFHPQSSQNLPPEAFLTENQLTEAGIPETARVLCPQDPSPNIALLAMQRHGWTAYNFSDRINADTLYKYQSRFGLSHLALRDTAFYGPLYREFFPVQLAGINGWYLYSK